MVTQRHRRLAAWLLVAGGCAVLLVTLWPTPIDAGLSEPLRAWLADAHAAGAPEVLRYGVIEFAANIAMFIPVGFVLAVLLPAGRRWLSPVICFALSLGIELGQALFRSGRLGDVTDLVGNTLGGLVGAGLLGLILWIARARARSTPA